MMALEGLTDRDTGNSPVWIGIVPDSLPQEVSLYFGVCNRQVVRCACQREPRSDLALIEALDDENLQVLRFDQN